jgi:Zn-dependent peptidase ImmA (M78 family)/transcriptional regulator with XRE-family HTH domain
MDLWGNQESQFNGRMLVLARESRGMTQKQLADVLRVPQSRISMIEMELRPVPIDLLDQLAEVLHYPREFFFQRSNLAGVGVSEVFHRKRAHVAKSVLAQIYAQIEIRFLHLDALLKSVDIECKIPRLDIQEFRGNAEEVARVVRSKLEVPRGPISNLTELLEDAGVLVISFDFGTREVDAISRWLPSLSPVMFVNTESPTDRVRHSLAHELGHLVIHDLPTPEMEEEADAFASEFLMPERDIRHELHHIDLARLALLKKYWRVSMASLLFRAKTLGTITPNQARYLWTQMSRAGYRLREPLELDARSEVPHLLYELVEVHLRELGYTREDLRKVLKLEPDEMLAAYFQQPRPDRPSLHTV